MSQDSDELPLALRQSKPKQRAVVSSDSEDALPDWAQNYRSPYTGGYRAGKSSDDDEPIDLTRPGLHSQADAAAKGQGSSLQPTAGTSESQQDPSKGIATPAAAPHAEKAARAIKTQQQQQHHSTEGQASPKDQQQHSSGDATKEAAAAAVAATPAGNKAAQLPRGEVPLVLPEKLPRNKALVELDPRDDDQAADLAGDAGAVGRVLISGKAGAEVLQIDLKGILYGAGVLPLAGTAMVVNIGPTEAKVETLINDYVRLKEEASAFRSETILEGSMTDLFASDDENYVMDDGAGGEDGEEGGKKKAKAGGKKAGGGAGGKGRGAGGAGAGKGKGLKTPKKEGKAKAAGGKAKGSAAKPKNAAAAGGGSAAKGGSAKKKPALGVKAGGVKKAGAGAGGAKAAAAAKKKPAKKKAASSDDDD